MKISKNIVSRAAVLGVTGSLLTGALLQAQDVRGTTSDTRGATGLTRSVANLERVAKLTGATVNDTAGVALGTIRDVVADTANGNIDFALISLNNATDRYTALPWTLLRKTGPTTYQFTGNVDTLRSAPTFTANNWPDFTRPNYAPEVYSHYGLTWPGHATARGATGIDQQTTTGREYYEDGRYYDEIDRRLWSRPQPDGKETFPALEHPDVP